MENNIINPVFIDWFSGFIPCTNNPSLINTLMVILDSKTGEVDKQFIKNSSVEGSFSSKVLIKSIDPETLYISYNPTKFLQGHNIVGTHNIFNLLINTIPHLNKIDGIDFNDFDIAKIKKGLFKITRLDITGMFDVLGSNLAVNEFIRAIQYQARTRGGKAVYSGNTAYFGKNSTYWSLKFYNKNEELKKHPSDILISDDVNKWLYGKLRVELTLRGKQLERHDKNGILCNSGQAWIDDKEELLINKLYNEYLGKVEIGENNMNHIDEETLSKLKPSLLMIYQSWLAGNDVALQFPRTTFYRYRRDIKASIGVDITEPRHQVKDVKSNIVPMIRILEAKPADIPAELFKGLVVGY
jgi:II/X family phage/plasmid replication protein